MTILFLPLGIFVLFFLEHWIFRKFWNRGLDVAMRFDGGPVTEGGNCSLHVEITNRNFLLLPVLKVDFQTDNGILPVGDENVSVSDRTHVLEIFTVRFYEKIIRDIPFACNKRGFYRILQTSQVAGDLFGEVMGQMNLPQQTHIYVYPKMLPSADYVVPYEKLLGEVQTRRRLYEDPFTFRGIRPYTPSDPQTSVNWKATAHTGSLMVNQKDHTSGQSVVFLLNLEEPAFLFKSELLEDSIRLVLTLSARLIRDSIPTGFYSNARDIVTDTAVRSETGSSPDHVRSVSEQLARIDLSKPRFSIEKIINEAAADNDDGKTYCLISTSQRQEIQACASALAGRKGSLLWISPLTDDMEDTVDDPRIRYVRFIPEHNM